MRQELEDAVAEQRGGRAHVERRLPVLVVVERDVGRGGTGRGRERQAMTGAARLRRQRGRASRPAASAEKRGIALPLARPGHAHAVEPVERGVEQRVAGFEQMFKSCLPAAMSADSRWAGSGKAPFSARSMAASRRSRGDVGHGPATQRQHGGGGARQRATEDSERVWELSFDSSFSSWSETGLGGRADTFFLTPRGGRRPSRREQALTQPSRPLGGGAAAAIYSSTLRGSAIDREERVAVLLELVRADAGHRGHRRARRRAALAPSRAACGRGR